MALLVLRDALVNSIEKGEYVLGVFLDLSKAFDTVSHEIMISKLEHYGIRGIALEWFKDYLRNRKQRVLYNEVIYHQRPSSHVECPRGPFLGP